MPSGRPTDRDRRRRRENPANRKSERVRRGKPEGKRPGGRGPVRSRPKSNTGGAFKLSSTRHAAVLALLVCAMALSVSVPLRTYMSQRAELEAQEQHQAELVRQVSALEQRRAELSDPAHVEAEARARLGLVRPGETPYIVEVPPEARKAPPTAPTPKRESDDRAWYEQLWESLTGASS